MPSEETRYKPGQSGNPKGKPKGALCFKTILRGLLEQPMDNPSKVLYVGKRKISAAERMIIALYQKALLGDVTAIKEIMNRADEVLVQKFETNMSEEDHALLEQWKAKQEEK